MVGGGNHKGGSETGSAGFVVKLWDGTCFKCVNGKVVDVWIEGEIPSASRYNSGKGFGVVSNAENGFGILMSRNNASSRKGAR